MDVAEGYIFSAGWVFFVGWGMILAVVGAVAFGRDIVLLLARSSQPRQPR
jgi:hypothetical protein